MTTNGSEPLVDIRNVTRYFYKNTSLLERIFFPNSREVIRAVDGVDLQINQGEVMAVVGESGCGKSTLARTILRLIEPTSGEIYFEGENIVEYSEADLRRYRRNAQMIFQDPAAALNPRKKVRKIILQPMAYHDIGDSETDRSERLYDLIDQVGLDTDHLNNYPHQLSGGQRQRVVIARALALEPKLLIADEPTSALDVSVQAQILDLLTRLQEEFNLTMLVISHDLSMVRYLSDRVAVMYLGQFIEKGLTSDVYQSPKHPYTQALLSSIPRPDPTAKGSRMKLKGTVPSPSDPPSGCRFHTRCPKIIPPPTWKGSQEEWSDLFQVKMAIEQRVTDSGEPQEGVNEPQAIIDNYLESTARDELSVPVQETLGQLEAILADGDFQDAFDLIDSEYTSPCEENDPHDREMDTEWYVSCFLYNNTVNN